MDHQTQDKRQTPSIAIPASAESTPLLPNPSPTKWYSRMQNYAPNSYTVSRLVASATERQSDRLFSCSPMVSGLRTLHLPNLELRDAAALAAQYALNLSARGKSEIGIAANSEHNEPITEGRKRSKSLGDAKERYSHLDRLAVAERMAAFHRDGKEMVSSGVSMCLVDDENGSNGHLQYGSLHDKTIDSAAEDEDADVKTSLRQSQSCTISNLGVEYVFSSPQASPTNARDTIPNETDTTIEKQDNQSPFISILYGLVNTSIILPVLMSFGSIIYHHDFFRPYLSTLMKLTVLSGAVHQITFSTASSLPFAVGQVQDAGLIFLSSMSRDLVNQLQSRGEDPETILATVCIGLSLSTALLGLALISVGKFRLASYMQMLPSCVVGGYLAYIGFFCGQAGLALMAQENVTGLNEWGKFLNYTAIVRIVPGIIGGIIIYGAVRTIRHMAVLPSCIVLLMLVFYSVLWATSTSVEEATSNGWINESAESQNWRHTWDFLVIDKVVWSVFPSQIGTLFAMISVVALSSSLDVAAIEIELKRPLDYNHELSTVGLSNVLSGLTGGYTGSYIFSQTIFSLRMGIRSRLMGYVIAFLSIVAVVIPFNILSFIPNMFFGSLLMLICLDLMFEWLIDARSKMTAAEYTVVLTTFGLLQVLGVEFGILAGVVFYFILKKIGCVVGS